jgi:hypothetical protein
MASGLRGIVDALLHPRADGGGALEAAEDVFDMVARRIYVPLQRR